MEAQPHSVQPQAVQNDVEAAEMQIDWHMVPPLCTMLMLAEQAGKKRQVACWIQDSDC